MSNKRNTTQVALKVLVIVCAFGGFFSACTPRGNTENDPKGRLTAYISKSFSVQSVEDRNELAGFMMGDAKNRLLAWSDQQFSQAFIENKRQFVKLLILELKALNDSQTNITYELTYLDQNRGKDAKVINKKLAHLVLDQDQWFIKEVQNIKETVEYRNEMALP